MNVWLSVLLSPITFLIFYDLAFIYRPILGGNGELPLQYTIFIILMDILMMISLVWLYHLSKHKAMLLGNRRHWNPEHSVSNAGYITILLIAVLLFLYLVYRVFGSFDLTNVYKFNQEFYSQSKVGTSWVFFFLYAFVFVGLYDIYLSGLTKFKVASIVILILVNAATGGRGNVITYLFLLLVIYGVVWRGKHVVLVSGTIFILAFSTFTYNTLFRSESKNISEYLESKSSVVDFNQVVAIKDSIDYWLESGPCYICFIEDLTYFFLPRSIFNEKPISNAETRRVYPNIAATGSTYTFGIYGSSLINLGIVSFFFIPFVFFIYSYGYFASLYSGKRNYIYFSMIYCGVDAVQFVRGGIFDIRLVRLLFTLMLAYLFYRSILLVFKEKLNAQTRKIIYMK